MSADLITVLNSMTPQMISEARRVPDAPAGSPEASMTLAQRQPRLNPASVLPDLSTIAAVDATQIDATGINLIKEFEGCVLTAYWDAYGHVWTIGFGETAGVHQGMVWTYAQAVNDLKSRLAADYEPAIRGLGVPLNQHQFDALCSFVWNLGPGSMSWDVGQLLRRREYTAAANAMLKYDTAGGVVLAGLQRRREAERALFLKPMPKPPDPHHYSRFPVLETFDHMHWDERAYVERYDKYRKHPLLYRKQLKISKGHMAELAKHAYDSAVSTGSVKKPDWSRDYLGWRWQELHARAEGKRVNS